MAIERRVGRKMASIGRFLPSTLQLFSQFGNGCCRLWRKSKFPFHNFPYVLNWRQVWRSCWTGQLYTTKSTFCHRNRVWTWIVLLEKLIFLSKKYSRMGLITYSWHWLLYLAKTPNLTTKFSWDVMNLGSYSFVPIIPL